MASIKETKRNRRRMHIRKNLSGTSERPRVYIYRSNKYIYAGVSDDYVGKVLMMDRTKSNIESSGKLGEKLGKELKKKKIEKVVFDRSGYKYHGRVKAIAEGLRKAGIEV